MKVRTPRKLKKKIKKEYFRFNPKNICITSFLNRFITSEYYRKFYCKIKIEIK